MNSDQQMQSVGVDEASCYHPLSEFFDHLEIQMENSPSKCRAKIAVHNLFA
jgi:hypothetical protein